MADLARLRSALAIAVQAGLTVSLGAIVKALREGRAVDVILARAAIRRMSAQTWAITERLYGRHFRQVLGGDFKNYEPLAELLRERERLHNFRVSGYAHLFEDSVTGALSIGRRTQDVVRELTLTQLERGMIQGSAATLQRDNLRRIMISRGRQDLADDIANGLDPRAELLDKIPLFHKDGKAKFWLRTQTGKFRAFDLDSYVDLVSVTTSEEANRIGQVEKARTLGTRLVKFNSTGKGKAFYLSINDTRCAAVDGEIFSIEPSGTWIDGIFFRYWRDALPGPYVTCHPNCQHTMGPIAEALAVSLVRKAA